MTRLRCEMCGHSRNRHDLVAGLYGACRSKHCSCYCWVRAWSYDDEADAELNQPQPKPVRNVPRTNKRSGGEG